MNKSNNDKNMSYCFYILCCCFLCEGNDGGESPFQ